MLSNLSYSSASVDRLLVTLSGMETLSELVHRDTDGPSSSALVVTYSGVQISGLISYLYYEVYDGNVWATNNINFITIPSGLTTITIGGIKYTFVQALSGLNNVPIRGTTEDQAVALFRVINTMGVPGTDFYIGQTANPYASGLFPDNPLTLRAVASGLVGNTLTITTTSSAVQIINKYFYGGRSSMFPTPKYFGYINSGVTNPNGPHTLRDIPSSSVGESYLVHTWFAGVSGLQALNSLGNLSDYWATTQAFTGRTNLPYYAEVSGLTAVNLIGGNIPSNGIVSLSWIDVSNWYRRSGASVKLAHPYASGVQVQASGIYSYADQGQYLDYVVFVFKSYSGSAPEASWPRSSDANGIWYYAGKTSNTATTLYLPPGSTSKYSIWVGFGNKATRTIAGTATGLPFRSTLSNIYIV
jgi:hypothetical protein